MAELKFYRSLDRVRPKAVPFIRQDIEKIEQLVKRGRRLNQETFLYGVVAVFAKYSGECREVMELADGTYDNVRVIVRSAKLLR